MLKRIIAAYLIGIASSAIAAPPQLEIIGIVPGKSTEVDVARVKDNIGFVIGGYELSCYPKYMNGVL